MQIRDVYLQTARLFPPYHFYKSVLGMNVTDDDKNHFTIHTLRTKIIFEQSVDSLSHPFYHFAFNIPSNKIEEVYKWLQERVQLLWLEDYNGYIADFKNWHAKSVYFFDPAGNIVEFIARFDLHDHVSEPFNSTQIRNVSEIGLVFPEADFDFQVRKLMNEYQLHYFEKQPPYQQFRAIGDDEGLFIIVPENRHWYPTTHASSKIFPMKINFQNLGREFVLRY